MIIKYIYTFILLITYSFANDYKIINLKEKGKESTNFPFVTSKLYKSAANNININLQFEMFQNTPKKKNLFLIKKNMNRTLYINSFYSIEEKNFLSITLEGEGCGAYCENFSKYFNFDKYTGQEITINDLFTKKGILEINKIIRKKNLKRISNFISINKNDLGDEEEYDEQTQMFQECLERRKGSKSYFTLNNYTSVLLEKNSMKIIHGRCSNHALRALDDIGSFMNTFTFKFLKPYLSSYGQNLLEGKQYKTPQNILNKRIWKGKIDNKYSIKLKNTTYGNWVYWYTKYNKIIELKSNYKNPFLYLEERIYHKNQKKWQTTSLIKLKLENNQLYGTYTNYSNNKVMKVFLE
jgi:hypothetical protein